MVDDRILRLEVRLEMLQEQVDAQQLVLSWLLAKHPDDEALMFLQSQANEFESESPRKFEEWIAVLDDLTDSVKQWREQWLAEPPFSVGLGPAGEKPPL